VFFAAYEVAYEPYRALYPNLVDDDVAAQRGQARRLLRTLAARRELRLHLAANSRWELSLGR